MQSIVSSYNQVYYQAQNQMASSGTESNSISLLNQIGLYMELQLGTWQLSPPSVLIVLFLPPPHTHLTKQVSETSWMGSFVEFVGFTGSVCMGVRELGEQSVAAESGSSWGCFDSWQELCHEGAQETLAVKCLPIHYPLLTRVPGGRIWGSGVGSLRLVREVELGQQGEEF